jgi:transcriptional repressor NrdR
MVIKKDGKRQSYDDQKMLKGLLKACEKRPIPVSELEAIVDEVGNLLQQKPGKEIEGKEIGKYIMKRLHDLDKVAYVRFASVYREFKDVAEFKRELEKILKEK